MVCARAGKGGGVVVVVVVDRAEEKEVGFVCSGVDGRLLLVALVEKERTEGKAKSFRLSRSGRCIRRGRLGGEG